jgi:hypothetical protein
MKNAIRPGGVDRRQLLPEQVDVGRVDVPPVALRRVEDAQADVQEGPRGVLVLKMVGVERVEHVVRPREADDARHDDRRRAEEREP